MRLHTASVTEQRSTACLSGTELLAGVETLASRREALTHLGNAVLAVRQGNRQRALDEIEAAMSLDPDSPILEASRERLLSSWWRSGERDGF